MREMFDDLPSLSEILKSSALHDSDLGLTEDDKTEDDKTESRWNRKGIQTISEQSRSLYDWIIWW